MKHLGIFLVFNCLIWRLMAQPSALPARAIVIDRSNILIDEEGQYQYETIVQNDDKVSLYTKEFFRRNNLSAGTGAQIYLTPYASNPRDFNQQLISFKFKNSRSEDVQIYIYHNFFGRTTPDDEKAHQCDRDINFFFGEGDSVLIDYLNLAQGTYLIDWISPNRHGIYKKISRRVAKSKQLVKNKITEISSADETDGRTNENRTQLQESSDQIEEWIDLFLNEDKVYKGFFAKESTKKNYVARYQHHYSITDDHLCLTSDSKYVDKLLIRETAVQKQKLGTQIISPADIVRYYQNKDLKRPQVVKKLLAVFEEK